MGIFKTIENTIYRKLLIFLTVIFLFGCKEPFEPNLPSVPQGFLVVEGFINAQGPTQIQLSRSTPMEQKKTLKPELNASVKIEGDDNSSFALSNMPGGLYTSNTLPINSSRKYRLRIKTKNAKEYLSDFVEVKITPAIDSVSWKEEEKGVQIYANTHDPLNKTIYYRYDYDETWEINSAYQAFYKAVIVPGGNFVIRPITSSDPQIYWCWKYDTSKSILLASSAKLEKDIIHLKPLLFIPTEDERIGVRYSIQVRQYALDKEGYEFLEQMKKNTESLGTIFDPQPSAIKGNIHSLSDPNEIVIGYIHATTVKEQRIFVSAVQLFKRGFSIYRICQSVKVPNHPDSLKRSIPPDWPYDAIWEGPVITHYLVSTSPCVDCRESGGKNVKPSYC